MNYTSGPQSLASTTALRVHHGFWDHPVRRRCGRAPTRRRMPEKNVPGTSRPCPFARRHRYARWYSRRYRLVPPVQCQGLPVGTCVPLSVTTWPLNRSVTRAGRGNVSGWK